MLYEYWLIYLRETSWTSRYYGNVKGPHAIGTGRMGSIEDLRSVVDPECCVIGIEGLRVVDASMMPEIPRANIQFSIVMGAEHITRRIGQAAG